MTSIDEELLKAIEELKNKVPDIDEDVKKELCKILKSSIVNDLEKESFDFFNKNYTYKDITKFLVTGWVAWSTLTSQHDIQGDEGATTAGSDGPPSDNDCEK